MFNGRQFIGQLFINVIVIIAIVIIVPLPLAGG